MQNVLDAYKKRMMAQNEMLSGVNQRAVGGNLTPQDVQQMMGMVGAVNPVVPGAAGGRAMQLLRPMNRGKNIPISAHGEARKMALNLLRIKPKDMKRWSTERILAEVVKRAGKHEMASAKNIEPINKILLKTRGEIPVNKIRL